MNKTVLSMLAGIAILPTVMFATTSNFNDQANLCTQNGGVYIEGTVVQNGEMDGQGNPATITDLSGRQLNFNNKPIYTPDNAPVMMNHTHFKVKIDQTNITDDNFKPGSTVDVAADDIFSSDVDQTEKYNQDHNTNTVPASLQNAITAGQNVSICGLSYDNVSQSKESSNNVSGAGIHFVHTIGSQSPIPGTRSNGWLETFTAQQNGTNTYSASLEDNVEYANDFGLYINEHYLNA